MALLPMLQYGIGKTPLKAARNFCPEGTLLVKYESGNHTGSNKDRLAYSVLKDIIKTRSQNLPEVLFDSTSGNYGISMGYLAPQAGLHFIAFIDETTFPEKREQLRNSGAEVRTVERGRHPDSRTARIALVRSLQNKAGWVWTNQYANPAGVWVHYHTTGPEIAFQSGGRIDAFVCSVGTGATICGTGGYIKKVCPFAKVVAVEPLGSTIFGGTSKDYATAGAGMREPSPLIRQFGGFIDCFCQVDDQDAIATCREFLQTEHTSIGITGGAVLLVARHLSKVLAGKSVVALVADTGSGYHHLMDSTHDREVTTPMINDAGPLTRHWLRSFTGAAFSGDSAHEW